ncbi:MAG: ATP-dependent DNA helicase RecG [Gemmatimonadota bacterium]
MSFSQLDKPVQFLKGVGPRRAEDLARMKIATARDILFHVPRRYDDASTIRPIAKLQVGEDASTMGVVRSMGVIPTRTGLRIFQAVLQDDSGMITCAWPGQPWLERKIRKGDVLLVSGPVRFYHGRQLHPREFTVLSRSDGERGAAPSAAGGNGGPSDSQGTIFVSYPASDDLPQWVFRRIFQMNLDPLLEHIEEEEYFSPPELEPLRLPGLRVALEALHRPTSLEAVEAGRRRLAYDELFFLQLAQARVRFRETVEEPGIAFDRTNRLIRPLHEALPFALTGAQTRVLREIYDDMLSPRRMNRLLQGDVGSGKTLVSLFAMLLAVESGYQAALMAPTELLAEQHAATLRSLAEPLGIEVALLTGRLGAKERRSVLASLDSGEASLVVGTHALIQEGVEFRKLGLVVVDEQHRFGVRQRMALSDSDVRPDTLVMSATPIPRSLALVLYGDLDVSVLDELPPGRTPVQTLLRYPGKREEVYSGVEKEVAAGRQAYIVYPLVDESDKLDLRSATAEFERLARDVFPERRLGLLHGQLPADEKEGTMRDFLAGDIDILVATSVIEVGIDVPNASVMVIEHAERFGLSQLHQLRGRVGRGAARSVCVLVAEPGEVAAERLRIFTSTHDGFEIAQADLRIRGQGDLFGAQQHGRDPILRFADLARDEDLLVEARDRARELIERDPEMEHPENARVRHLLEGRYAERLKLFKVG